MALTCEQVFSTDIYMILSGSVTLTQLLKKKTDFLNCLIYSHFVYNNEHIKEQIIIGTIITTSTNIFIVLTFYSALGSCEY